MPQPVTVISCREGLSISCEISRCAGWQVWRITVNYCVFKYTAGNRNGVAEIRTKKLSAFLICPFRKVLNLRHRENWLAAMSKRYIEFILCIYTIQTVIAVTIQIKE